jgi:hypothetical protein
VQADSAAVPTADQNSNRASQRSWIAGPFRRRQSAVSSASKSVSLTSPRSRQSRSTL